MSVTIKSGDEIEAMRKAGRITADAIKAVGAAVRPGITTKQLDIIAEDYIRSMGAVPSFKGLYGYPASICTSVNEQVVHGIPSDRVLKEGDIISIDAGACIDGFHGDAARTFAVGEILPKHQKLIDVTEKSFFCGISFAKAGNFLYKISGAIQDCAEGEGYGVVRDCVGHGIGKAMHEDPDVPNYRNNKRGIKLRAGMTLAIEPMVNIGTHKVRLLSDRWTLVTRDGSYSAHYENTVLILPDGREPEILTMSKDQGQKG